MKCTTTTVFFFAEGSRVPLLDSHYGCRCFDDGSITRINHRLLRVTYGLGFFGHAVDVLNAGLHHPLVRVLYRFESLGHLGTKMIFGYNHIVRVATVGPTVRRRGKRINS